LGAPASCPQAGDRLLIRGIYLITPYSDLLLSHQRRSGLEPDNEM
jgi:hypothetical protein